MVVFDFKNFNWAKIDKTTAQKLATLGFNFKPPMGPQWEIVKQGAQASKALRKIISETPNCQIVNASGRNFGRQGQLHPSIFTVAGGGTAGLADGIGLVGGAGVWGSNNGQKGWYVSGGVQAMTNIAGGIGVEVTYIWGPPSDLNGPSINLGLDVGPNLVSGSGRLIVAIKNNPFRLDLVGVSFAITAGFSVLPLNLTVEFTGTRIGVF